MRFAVNPSSSAVLITSGDETNVAPAGYNGFTAPLNDFQAPFYVGNFTSTDLTTNTSAQVGARAAAASTNFYGVTRGWDDFRRS